jgi:hypothetical protein
MLVEQRHKMIRFTIEQVVISAPLRMIQKQFINKNCEMIRRPSNFDEA